MNRDEGWYACDACDVLGVGEQCWLCRSSDLYRGPGCKWPGSGGRRADGERPYYGGHSINEYGSVHAVEPDVTWAQILADVGEPPSGF